MQTLYSRQDAGPTPMDFTQPIPGKPRRRRLTRLIASVIVAVVLFSAGLAVAAGGDAAPDTGSPSFDAAALPAGAEPAAILAPVAEGPSGPLPDASSVGKVVIPSVVTVQIQGNQQNVVGSGSGVVYSADGLVITNAHVVEAGADFQVVLSDGRISQADLVGSDPITDIAVLRIQAKGLTPIMIGSTAVLDVGDPAIAVGSPLGLEGGPSLSVGVVSAFGRVVRTDASSTLYGMLQADAPITQGSSGGALVDASGRLIGITSAVGVSEVGVEGIGFSTPAEIAVRVADEIIASGEATRPYLGITGTTAFGPTADGGEQPIGVSIESVEPGTAAESGGLQAGDIVTSIQNTRVRTMQDLVARLRHYSAGDAVQLSLQDSTVTISLGNR